MVYYLRAFLQGIRIKTLPAVIVPILMSSAWAFHKKNVLDLTLLFWILISGILIQSTVNLMNDAMDFKSGTDKKNRKGPARLTEKNILSYKQVLTLGFICGGLALLSGLPLIFRGGWPIFIIGMASLFLCYFYSASPLALVRTGLSDLFVILFFGFIAVGGTYYIHTLEWDIALSSLGLQCGLWALSILIVNHLRDEKEDRASLRRNFVILYGREFGLLELICAQSFIHLLSFYWMNLDLAGGFLTFLLLPFSIWLVYKICSTKPSSRYNLFLVLMCFLYIIFGFLWILGFAL